MVCERCGTNKCIDKKFVPYNLLYAVEGYKDCPKFYGPPSAPHTPGVAPLQGKPRKEEPEEL